jgi:hypothetical protein
MTTTSESAKETGCSWAKIVGAVLGTGAVASVLVSAAYIWIFPPSWHIEIPQAQDIDSIVINVVPRRTGQVRDFYLLPCDRQLSLRRLWSHFTHDKQSVGVLYVIPDIEGFWLPARSNRHGASIRLENARRADSNTSLGSTGSNPFRVSDPADYPSYVLFQGLDPTGQDPKAIVVSVFETAGQDARSGKELKLQKWTCG